MSESYAALLEVEGLAPARANELARHIERSNAARADRAPVEPAVARVAACFLAIQPDTSTPLALAIAQNLTEKAHLGPAVLHLHAGLTDLRQITPDTLTRLAMNREDLVACLRTVEREAAQVRARLESLR